ncbi:hypothetical protein BV25DRAFT_1917786 [Artomyces pyxidatus]|uniref:Uncharacterized protein n=1 Tax=Artomyces pyxidatus TaxID=48021 RepID=A0ACB8SVE5_9AGAM|nr:hypothetical protein BV25DRAFT_1917786 [Artomyces pyxidatus]
MENIPIDIAVLSGVLVTGMLYGVHLVTFGKVLWVLFSKTHSRQSGRVHLMIATLLLFAVGTAYIAVTFRHVLDAFVWYTGPGGPTGQLTQISNKVLNMVSILYIVQTSLGDGMLIYRCYIVYQGNWNVVFLPITLWVACVVLGGFQVHTALTIHEVALLSTSELVPFTTSALSMTLAVNLITTSLIVGKIWLIQRQSRRLFGSDPGGRMLTRAIVIVVESGAMYTTAVFVFFVLDLCSSNVEYPVGQCVVQIIGIAFNLIIIRVDQGRTAEKTATRLAGAPNKRSTALPQYIRKSTSESRRSLSDPDSTMSLPERVHSCDAKPVLPVVVDSSSTIMDISALESGKTTLDTV